MIVLSSDSLKIKILFFICFLLLQVESKDKLYTANKETILKSSQDVWFESLSEDELSQYFSHDDGGSLTSKIKELERVEQTIMVEVRLVGFSGDGRLNFRLQESDLMKYFDLPSVRASSPPYVILLKGEHGGDLGHEKDDESLRFRTVLGQNRTEPKKREAHTLPFGVKILWKVTKADPKLITSVNNAIESALINIKTAEPASVPYNLVDDVIRADYTDTGLGYTIYVLNPDLRYVNTPDGRQPLIYTYDQRKPFEQFPADQFLPRAPRCPVVAWASDLRYVWIDLTAGPISYGPHTSGDGLVNEYTFPNIAFYQQGKSLVNTAKKSQFTAELASLLRSSVRQLITPSIYRFPLNYYSKVVINIAMIHESANYDTDDSEWNPIIEELQGLALSGQQVSVLIHHIQFDECPLCVAAYTHSLKTHTSNVLMDGLRNQVHQYLDSVDMRDWLEHFDNSFWGIAASTIASIQATSETPVRVVNAFVYDLQTTDIILLDRFHQAVSYQDLVIAVQSRASVAVMDFTCNNRALQFDPRRTHRAVLAAILQTTWGVTPSYLSWNPLYNDTQEDYLWTTGLTPFAYFSPHTKLSFSLKDSAARNIIYSEINETMSELASILQNFATFDKELAEVLSSEDHLLFVRRWNVFSFKLKKAHYFAQHNNFNQSLYYIRSARHDLVAIHMLLHRAIRSLTTVIVCKQAEAPRLYFGFSKSTVQLVFLGAFIFFVFWCTWCGPGGDHLDKSSRSSLSYYFKKQKKT